ncbi:family 20 glycosylhydrolase [Terriglobus sp. 2YAB30_2]|uniref:family 20 glycosylhydrolase n=1 Tax=unclassified Terriglobus TaxID=2628988 RepID=UPI003F9AC617
MAIRRTHWSLCLSLPLLASSCLAQPTHSPLLPRPQKVSYAKGSYAACSLKLRSANYSREDVFTLKTLETTLRQQCQGPGTASIPVVLEDDAAQNSLPGPSDEQTHTAREGYRIVVDRAGVKLHGNSSVGLYYAAQTFSQLFEGASSHRTLPFVDVTDEPALPYRGFMYDTAHGGAPTVAEIKRQLDLLAQWKVNQYYLYVETNIDLNGYPLLHRESNYTRTNIQDIVAYARERHIDVVPCVELYGHLHDLFREEKYSSLAALPHGGEANPAEAKVLRILEDWLHQYAELFPSPWIHIGFDEPFELGRAGTRASSQSPDELWLHLLQRMAELSVQQHKRPLFWADIDEGAYIFNKYPGLAANLPKTAIAVPWFYDARPSYDGLLTLFAQNHVPILVATGISDWDTVTPDFDSTFTNIDGFLAAARGARAFGMVNTQWSDSAQALHRQAEAGVAYGAAAAWQAQPIARDHFFDEYAHVRYGEKLAMPVSKALQNLAKAQTLLRSAIGRETSFRLWDDPFEPHTLADIKTHAKELEESRLAAETARETLQAAIGDTPVLEQGGELSELLFASRVLDFVSMKFLYAIEIEKNFQALPEHPSTEDIQFLLSRETAARNHSRIGDLMDECGDLKLRYRELWLQQYKPYRLATAEARWDAELEFWRHLQASLWTLRRNFKEGGPRPTLEDVLSKR